MLLLEDKVYFLKKDQPSTERDRTKPARKKKGTKIEKKTRLTAPEVGLFIHYLQRMDIILELSNSRMAELWWEMTGFQSSDSIREVLEKNTIEANKWSVKNKTEPHNRLKKLKDTLLAMVNAIDMDIERKKNLG